MNGRTTTNGSSARRQWYSSIAVAALSVLAVGWLTVVAAQDMANGTLAAAIRASNQPCDRVLEKKRVSEKPAVWRVRCNSGYYEVTMTGDTATGVVSID